MNVEPCELGPYAPVSDLLILAAVERSRRHGDRTTQRQIAHHLGFESSASATRRLRPQLEALREDGSLQSEGKKGRKDTWLLTRRGRGRLAAVRRAGDLQSLPESPQHRIWRREREAAGAQIEEIRSAAEGAVAEAHSLLLHADDKGQPPPSERLLELCERLYWLLWRLGAATHCLYEWQEPDDSQRDEDKATPGPFPRRWFHLVGEDPLNPIGGHQ